MNVELVYIIFVFLVFWFLGLLIIDISKDKFK